jgi:AraC-like DNA-binding protein
MAPRRHSILPVAFANPVYPALGLEPLRLSDLLGRVAPGHFAVPQRPGFHLLLLVTGGHGDHFLDFSRVRCRAGTLIHIRPGQVQQFVLGQALEANVLMFKPEFVLPAPSPPGMRGSASLIDDVAPEGVAQLTPVASENLNYNFAAIEREYRTTDGSAFAERILQHLLYALLLAIARESLRSTASPSARVYAATFRKFRKAVEAQFTRTRVVDDYAREVGCSVKSLRRACAAERDLAPKVVIEQRVILEAKRLLAHTDLPVETIADAVGFSESTNFVKFFGRHAGMRPLEFRNSFPGHIKAQADNSIRR